MIEFLDFEVSNTQVQTRIRDNLQCFRVRVKIFISWTVMLSQDYKSL